MLFWVLLSGRKALTELHRKRVMSHCRAPMRKSLFYSCCAGICRSNETIIRWPLHKICLRGEIAENLSHFRQSFHFRGMRRDSGASHMRHSTPLRSRYTPALITSAVAPSLRRPGRCSSFRQIAAERKSVWKYNTMHRLLIVNKDSQNVLIAMKH